MQRTRRVVAVIVIAGTALFAGYINAAHGEPRDQRARSAPIELEQTDWFGSTIGGAGAVATFLHAWAVNDYLIAWARAAGSTVGAPNEAHWLRIHECEQPGDWYADGSTSDGHFQGGLGISTDAWRENSQGMPASALAATPFEQMIVAQRIYDRFGPSAWGCK